MSGTAALHSHFRFDAWAYRAAGVASVILELVTNPANNTIRHFVTGRQGWDPPVELTVVSVVSYIRETATTNMGDQGFGQR